MKPRILSRPAGSGDALMARVVDFTAAELFPAGSYISGGYGAYFCQECGAQVADMGVHVTWHNKLLP